MDMVLYMIVLLPPFSLYYSLALLISFNLYYKRPRFEQIHARINSIFDDDVNHAGYNGNTDEGSTLFQISRW